MDQSVFVCKCICMHNVLKFLKTIVCGTIVLYHNYIICKSAIKAIIVISDFTRPFYFVV